MPSDSPNSRLNRINYLVLFDFKTTWLNSIQTQSLTLLFLMRPEMYIISIALMSCRVSYCDISSVDNMIFQNNLSYIITLILLKYK
jgi:hypothetical protein